MRINEIALGRSVRYPFFSIFDVVQQKVPGQPGLKIRFQRRGKLPPEVMQSGIYAWHHPDWGYFYVGIASKNNFRERWYKHIQKLLDQCTSAAQMRNWKQFADRFAAAGYGMDDLKDITLRFFPIPPDLGDDPETFKRKLGAIEDRIVAALNPACNYQHDPTRPSSTKYPQPRTTPNSP
jgi:GIY-YIG catalytic domain